MDTNESRWVLIGRNRDGEKVYVKARFEYLKDATPGVATERENIDHEMTTERLRLGVNGVRISKYGNLGNDRSWLGCGQNDFDLLELTTLETGWTVADVMKLHELWQRWHLNDMRAACAHQVATNPDDKMGTTPPCPETGYSYGEKWLYESLPYSVFAFFVEKFEISPPVPGSN